MSPHIILPVYRTKRLVHLVPLRGYPNLYNCLYVRDYVANSMATLWQQSGESDLALRREALLFDALHRAYSYIVVAALPRYCS